MRMKELLENFKEKREIERNAFDKGFEAGVKSTENRSHKKKMLLVGIPAVIAAVSLSKLKKRK